MIPSDHFVRFYNEVFKYIVAKGPDEIRKYYDRVSKNQEYHCLKWFKEKGLRGMFEYWEHIRVEENCDMANHLEDDCYWFEFFSCPSLSKAVDNDAGACSQYCNHCPGWILPIMTKTGYYAVYNLISRTEPRCQMFVYKDPNKAQLKKSELLDRFTADVIVDNLADTHVTRIEVLAETIGNVLSDTAPNANTSTTNQSEANLDLTGDTLLQGVSDVNGDPLV